MILKQPPHLGLLTAAKHTPLLNATIHINALIHNLSFIAHTFPLLMLGTFL